MVGISVKLACLAPLLFEVAAAASHVEPYLRVDGTKVWSLMQLERHLHPDAYGRVRGGYIVRRRPRATGA
jgi:hypothetical protein